MATIDILLPVKNGIDFLAESLESVCNQSFKDWRLLVLDHGSTDGSIELASKYHARDARVEVHSYPEADGLAGLLNRGLDLCDCKYVMRHDADDVCFPNRMEVTLAAFKDQPDCAVIGGQSVLINAKGAMIGDISSIPIGRERVAAASLFRNPISHPTSTLDFSVVQKLGVRYGVDFLNILPPEKQIEVKGLAEDYFMFGQLAILGKCSSVPVQLIKYRWHGNNVSATRFHEQMEVSCRISRFLVRTLCTIKNLPYFDPIPFCNHGGALYDVDGKVNFVAEFEQMADILRRGFGISDQLERELAFRRIASTRNDIRLLWNYYQFRSKNMPEAGEWNTVRAWLLRYVPGKSSMKVNSELML